MQVNDSRGWLEQMVLAKRRKDWEFSEQPGYVHAACRHCTESYLLPATAARARRLALMDEHQQTTHGRCSGDLHTTPHKGCILR